MIKLLNRENPLCFKTDIAMKMSQAIFFLTYGLYLALQTVTSTTYIYDHSTSIFTQCAWICCFLALLNIIFLCRYSIGQLMGIMFFLGIYFFIWFNIDKSNCTFLQSMILVFSCQQVEWRHNLKFSFDAHIILILVPIFMELVGILPVIEVFRGDSPRYTLGFSHPNVLGGICLCIVIIWLLLRYKKLKAFDYLSWLAIAIFLWIVPNSRTSTLLVFMICFLAIIFKHWGDRLVHNTIVQSILLSFGWIMAAFSIIAALFYDGNNEWYVWLDKNLFTGRLSCSNEFLNAYPVTFFGQKLELVSSVNAEMNGTQSHILDNFYVRQLLQLGIVSFLIILVLFTLISYYAIRKNDQATLIGITIIMIYGVYENYPVNLFLNILLFQVVYLILDKDDNKNDKSICNHTSI